MNIESYLKRIGWEGALNADFATLKQIHFLHATNIPFENLDIQLGRKISLDLDALQRKLVENIRGGYCFEHNTLLQAVLKEIGFEVIACEARVRMGSKATTPRTHMLLIVTIEHKQYLADVGFGGDGLLYPVEICSEEQKQFLWSYRVIADDSLIVLQALTRDGWMDLYGFLPEKREPIDFELANWFTSTHPESRFVQTLTAQQPTSSARYILRNRTFTIDSGDQQESRTLSNPQELLELLRSHFNLSFPAETRFLNPKF